MLFRKLCNELESQNIKYILVDENYTNKTSELVYELSFESSEMVIKEIELNDNNCLDENYIMKYNKISVSKKLEYLDELNKYLRFFSKIKKPG